MARAYWYDSPGPGIGYRHRVMNEIGVASRYMPIADLVMRMAPDCDLLPLDVSPDYQRAHVWTVPQAEAFVGAFAERTPIPAVFIRHGRHPAPDQVVDGKQRLTALRRFTLGEIGAVLSDGRRLSWADFDLADRRVFMIQPIPVVFLHESTTEAEVLRTYLRINRGGTPHTADEIARVEHLLAVAEGLYRV